MCDWWAGLIVVIGREGAGICGSAWEGKKIVFHQQQAEGSENSIQTNRGQEPRTHNLWGIGPLRWRRGQTFCKLSLSASPSTLCWPTAPPPQPPPSSLPDSPLWPPSPPHRAQAWGLPDNGDNHASTSMASWLWQSPQIRQRSLLPPMQRGGGGTSCRQNEKWKPSYGFIPNGWRQKESVKKERKNKE
jgi:hypothetical protein